MIHLLIEITLTFLLTTDIVNTKCFYSNNIMNALFFIIYIHIYYIWLIPFSFFFFPFALVHESTLSTNCEEVSFCSSGSAGC